MNNNFYNDPFILNQYKKLLEKPDDYSGVADGQEAGQLHKYYEWRREFLIHRINMIHDQLEEKRHVKCKFCLEKECAFLNACRKTEYCSKDCNGESCNHRTYFVVDLGEGWQIDWAS